MNHPTPLAAWTIDFRKGWHGSIEWKADVLPPAETRAQILFKPGDNVGWLRARQPVTNAVRTVSGETEGWQMIQSDRFSLAIGKRIGLLQAK